MPALSGDDRDLDRGDDRDGGGHGGGGDGHARDDGGGDFQTAPMLFILKKSQHPDRKGGRGQPLRSA